MNYLSLKFIFYIFIEISDAYGFNSLKNLTEYHLIKAVNEKNSCMLIEIAHNLEALRLRNYCIKYITDNFKLIFDTEDYKKLEDNNSSLLLEITKNVFQSIDIKNITP